MDFRTVGWISDGEWAQVYKQLFQGSTEDKQHALEIIEVWRVRFAMKIPVAIEVTYRLFETLLGGKSLSKGLKQQSYAAAILQFVGLLTEHLLKRNPMTIRSLGGVMGLPEWVIDLRNTMAHGPLPSHFMLDKAVHFGLNWLKENHWDVQAQYNSMCVQVPYMTAIVGGKNQVTLDDRISLILHDMKLSEKDDIEYNENVLKLNKICKEKHAIERLCIVFVQCDHYKFSVDLYNLSDFEQESVPIDVVRLWKPMLNCVVNSHHTAVLLYAFIHSLCDCTELAKKTMLAPWSMYLINSLCDPLDFKNLILNECVKLLLSSSKDFYSSVLFKNLLQAMIQNGEHSHLQELALLHKTLNSSKMKNLSGKPIVKTLEDILHQQVNTTPANSVPEVTWSLYEGEILASCPIGLVHEQSQDGLAKQLYGFRNWSLQKLTNKPETQFDNLDDGDISYQNKIEETSDNSLEGITNLEDMDSTNQFTDYSSNENISDVENESSKPTKIKSGFDEFSTDDWTSIALSIDTF